MVEPARGRRVRAVGRQGADIVGRRRYRRVGQPGDHRLSQRKDRRDEGLLARGYGGARDGTVDGGRNALELRRAPPQPRSEERRVGKEWVSTCRYRWWPSN